MHGDAMILLPPYNNKTQIQSTEGDRQQSKGKTPTSQGNPTGFNGTQLKTRQPQQ
jgi:hypothetical protein